MTPPSGPADGSVVPIEQLFYDDGKPGIVDAQTVAKAMELLDGSIAALEALANKPLGKPVALAEDEVVPIEVLLYKGSSALDRAIELRAVLTSGKPPEKATLDELFDLIELARAG